MKIDSLTLPARNRIAARAVLVIMAVAASGAASAQNHNDTVSAGGNAANQMAWIQYIAGELRRIHMELLEDRRDFQQAKLQDLEREIDTVRTQQQQVQEEQRSQTQQAVEIEGRLVQASLSNQERAELEEQRADLLAQSPSKFGSVQNALAQREARARERLALQEQRVRAIDRQIRELSAPSQ